MAGLYAALIILLNIPYIQHKLSVFVSDKLEHLLQTEVSIQNINIGLLNRIILDDVCIHDREGKELLKASRISAKFDIQALLQGRITINNIQLYRMHLDLARQDSAGTPNYQFLVDALSSDRPSQEKNDLHLRINALLIRHGRIAYNIRSAQETPGRWNPRHILLNDVRANISLKALENDSINTTVRHLSFTEQSGFALNNLSFKLVANSQGMILSRFALELPSSQIKLDTLAATYNPKEKEFAKTIRVDGNINRSFVTLSDLKSFVPDLASFTDPLWIEAGFKGTSEEVSLRRFRLHSNNNDVLLLLNCRVRNPFIPSQSFIDCTLPELHITHTGLRFLTRNLGMEMTPVLTRLGYLSLEGSVRGTLQNLQLQGLVKSIPGNIQTDLQMGISNHSKTCSGNIRVTDFQLGSLLGNDDLGRVSLHVHVEGMKPENGLPTWSVIGHLPRFEYKQYDYGNIGLNGSCREGNYKGLLSVNDPNVRLTVKGRFTPTRSVPELNLAATISRFRPEPLRLSTDYPDTDFSASVQTNIKGNTPDNIEGHISIDSLRMVSPTEHYMLRHFAIHAESEEERQRKIEIESDFLNGEAHGLFRFATLPQSFACLLNQYLPSLFPSDIPKHDSNNRLSFDLKISNTDLLVKMLHIPVNLYMPGTIKGYFHERNRQMKMEGYLPSFTYNGTHYESGMLLIDNPQDRLEALVRVSKQMKNSSMLSLSLKAEAYNNKLRTSFNWGNNTQVTYSGEFATVTEFFKRDSEKDMLSAKVKIQPSDVIINDTTWTLRNSTIAIDSGRIAINNFCFEHDDQHLRINGNLTENSEDSLCIDLNDIRLEYIFDIIQFHPVDFRGSASGKAYIKQAMKNPSLDANLNVRRFTFNHGLMGDMKIRGLWNAKDGNILLDADIQEPSTQSRTTVKGWVSPPKAGLDLRIKADKTNLKFLNAYTGNIFNPLTGNVTGDIHLHGPFSDLNLEGRASGTATAKVDVLHTTYDIRLDSVSLLPGLIEFNKVSIADKNGHKGQVTGSLHHNHLRDIRYKFIFDTDNVLLYDAPERNEDVVYGSIYGTGLTTLQGDNNELNIDTNIRTGKNTTFIYNLGKPEDIADNGFITFTDKTPHPKWEQEHIPDPFKRLSKDSVIQTEDTATDIRINAQLDVTPDANIKVIMDPISGDYAMAQGNGNLQIGYYNKGGFKLFGTYTLEHGVYKLSLQEVIRKDFQLQPGGSITFSGLPENGDINLQAIYTVNTASLKDLAPNATFTQSSVKVNCLLNLTGKLATPNIHFDLEFPNINDEERELIRSYINTDEQMETQIIYLLGIGRFYTYDYANTNMNDNSSQSSAMNSLLSSTLSGQLNNMLSHVIDSNTWNFGTNLSTGDKGWTDMEVEGMLSGRLLNNRLLINGNFGYRDNQLANTNFIGDFDVQWLLTPSGDISLKGYNQTNDRYFAKTTLTTQGIGILFKRDFEHWKELFHRNYKIRKDSLSTDSTNIKKKGKKKKQRKTGSNSKKIFGSGKKKNTSS